MIIALFVLIAYLLGSVPTAVWIGKTFYGTDVRKHGSKNAGATNTFRVLGKPAGFMVFFLDVAKGYLAILIVQEFYDSTDELIISTVKVLAAIAAVLGHVFPIFANFKGGKGVATAFGILLALTLQAAGICFAIFLFIWLISNYVSLGSITAAFFYPIVQFFINPEQDDVLLLFTILLALTVVFSHNRNIKRLLNGVETKTYPFRNKQSKKR
jgi:glycerol-3-phosphate acyltransferase PlsY